MNAIWAIIHHPFADRLGWIILHSLWQGALIGMGFGLLRLALRNQSAQARYLAGCVCLILVMGAPLLTLVMSPGPIRESNADFSAVLTASSPLAAESPALPPTASDENLLLWAIQSVANFFGRLAPWLTAAWLLGVALSSCRLLRSFWWVQTIRKRDTDAVDEVLLERLDNFRRHLLISRPVRLLKSALVEVPTVVGWLRPIILLPASSLAGLTPNQLDAILVHELAHVRRLDYIVNIFQSLIETLMFYHPAVWWISRSIREEREHCCDDLVVQVCGNRADYVRALATLEELRNEMPQLAFAASGGSLLSRIRRLAGVTETGEAMNARQTGGLALLGIGLLFIVLGIYLNLATPMYRATARIKVDRDTSAQLGTENGKVTLTVGDPYFAQTVVEVIRSEAVLRGVANNLGLLDEWGKRYNLAAPTRTARVIHLLREKLSVRAVPNSTLFEISCLSEKPEEAKKIANAVAEAYRNHRNEAHQELSHRGIASLEDRWQQQQEIIRKAASEVDRLRLELGIPETVTIANPGSSTIENAPAMLMTTETLRRLEANRIELEAQVTQQEALLKYLRSTPREKLVYSLPTASPDPVLTSLLEQKTLAEQALIIRQKDFGSEHPDVVKTRSQLEDIKVKINDQMDGILLGLDTRASALREQLKKLKDEVEKATSNDIDLAKKSRPYFEAKRRLEEAERFSQVLAMKVASEKIEAALPKSNSVEIMDLAEVPLRAIYPNRAQAAALILFGILLDFTGLRMIRARPRLTPVLQPA